MQVQIECKNVQCFSLPNTIDQRCGGSCESSIALPVVTTKEFLLKSQSEIKSRNAMGASIEKNPDKILWESCALNNI